MNHDPASPDLKKSWEAASASTPWLTKLLYPRRYVGNELFPSPQDVATQLYFVTREGLGLTKTLPRNEYLVGSMLTVASLIKMGMPTYFLGRTLLLAAQASILPATLELSDIKWPLEALLFILPKGGVRTFDGCDVEYLAVSHNQPDPDFNVHPKLPGFTIRQEDVTVVASAGNSSFSADIHYETPLRDQLAEETEVEAFGHEDPLPGHAADVLKEIRLLLIKLLLLMSARKNLISSAVCLRPGRAKRRKAKEALWSPNILGNEYRLRMVDPPSDPLERKRLHWVRGHFRQQPYGSRVAPRYATIWIEPFLSGTA